MPSNDAQASCQPQIKKTMEELINKICTQAGITPEQAVKSLEAVKDYVKEKFPMMAGAVDNLFGNKSS
jgi:hypothetical protein